MRRRVNSLRLDSVSPYRILRRRWVEAIASQGEFVAARRRLALPISVATLGEAMRCRVSSLRLDGVSPYRFPWRRWAKRCAAG